MRVKAQLEKLVDAICNGTPAAAIRDRMQGLEDRRLVLEAKLASAVAPAPRLHPNLAILYREKVAHLTDTLHGNDGAIARDAVRGLVENVRLVPEGGSLRVDLRGELASILALAGGADIAGMTGPADALAVQMKMVAGTGNHRELTLPAVIC